ncbi:uncharacterized protein LOC143894277 [Temnothorax americanus]|uniref:uncharacterized protein LOC143894277 n=1 Tax=Temnothorax americanus TaxID=1964332 RepID=UPI004067FACA
MEKQCNETDTPSVQVSNEYSAKIRAIEERHSISFLLVSKTKCYTIEELKLQCSKASQVIQDLRVERDLGLQQLCKMFSEIAKMEKALRKLHSAATKCSSKKCKTRK